MQVYQQTKSHALSTDWQDPYWTWFPSDQRNPSCWGLQAVPYSPNLHAGTGSRDGDGWYVVFRAPTKSYEVPRGTYTETSETARREAEKAERIEELRDAGVDVEALGMDGGGETHEPSLPCNSSASLH